MSDIATKERRCTAHSSRSGQPCRRWAINGGTVCATHGGRAPQVIAKAEQRLREMVDPMLSKLHALAMQTDNLKVASECVRDALDRAGVGELVQAKVRASHQSKGSTDAKVQVNIGFLESRPMKEATLETTVVMGHVARPALARHEGGE